MKRAIQWGGRFNVNVVAPGAPIAWRNKEAAPGGGGKDPYWADVTLRLPMDVDFNDVSSSPQAANVVGDPVITPAALYGAGAGDFDSNDYVEYTGGTAPGFGDFTVECWVKFAVGSTDGTLLTIGNVYGQYYSLFRSGGRIRVFSSAYLLNSQVVPDDTWAHIALTRNAGVVELFVDGVSAGTSSAARDLPDLVVVSGPTAGGVTPMIGFLDDVRLTNGVVRYSADFTPPTEALPTS